jgi:coniferyl-aldehyde dehydrogenase
MNQVIEAVPGAKEAPHISAGQPADAAALRAAFQKQRQAYLSDPIPDLAQRREDLLTLKRLLSENVDQVIAAISADYGNRSRHETLFAEIITVTDGINDAIRHLKRWMKPQRRHVDRFLYPGAKNRLIPQPLGVVGLIIPWNFPVNLAFSQLTGAFAAGNRAMVKLSENSMALAALLKELSPNYFPPEKLAWFEET